MKISFGRDIIAAECQLGILCALTRYSSRIVRESLAAAPDAVLSNARQLSAAGDARILVALQRSVNPLPARNGIYSALAKTGSLFQRSCLPLSNMMLLNSG